MRSASFFIVLIFCIGLLYGCSHGPAGPIVPQGSFVSSDFAGNLVPDEVSFRSFYSFGHVPNDGSAPQSSPLSFNGAIYGTTSNGGGGGFGTVFSITSKGVEKIWHSFKQTDGSQPGGDMIASNNVLYGTTYTGGKIGFGTVFSLERNGTFRVLHSFADNATDGGFIQSGLVRVGTKFYGTTEGGGKSDHGTIFSITSTGDEHVLHSFSGTDGSEAGATLIVVNGMLYGTTFAGGKFNGGTAFRASLNGQVKVLHNFGNAGDGSQPFNRFVDVEGTLYGTTGLGGANGDGTVFKMSLGGQEKVIYSFAGGADGCTPFAGLAVFKGFLYGTTFGGSKCGSNGTVFRVSVAGAEVAIHVFAGGKGGANPYGGLGLVGEKLYGTTQNAGLHNAGTVFSVAP